MTIVVFSSCEGPHQTGDWPSGKYNGGVKLQNLWVKLLRQHGIEAVIATYDGRHQDWLMEHQPHVSIDTVRAWIQQGLDVRVVTAWLAADMVLDLTPRSYFFDAELGHSSCGTHFDNLKRRINNLTIGTHSRTQQAWYMATFGITPAFIREWSDPDYWKPCPERRVPGLVGYMNEGPQTIALVSQLATLAPDVQFMCVSGNEADVIAQMQACDVFLGLNPGKHPLWGEGCPRAPQEAMQCGCIVVAWDVHGNHEYLIDGYTGRLVRRGDLDGMARALIEVMNDPDREVMRARSLDFIRVAFGPTENKWQQVKAFLEV